MVLQTPLCSSCHVCLYHPIICGDLWQLQSDTVTPSNSKPILEDKTRMENALRASSLRWVSLRAGEFSCVHLGHVKHLIPPTTQNSNSI